MFEPTPRQLMIELAYGWEMFGFVSSSWGKHDKPGRAYASLSEESKEILKNLKSEDLSSGVWNLDCWYFPQPSRKRSSVYKIGVKK